MTRFKKMLLGFTLIVCAILGLLSGIVQTQTLQQAQIAFASNRDGNWNIYMMDVDGRNPRKVTDLPGDEWYPSWSPDGRRIAFAYHFHEAGGQSIDHIYVVDIDGKNLHQLVTFPSSYPSWSPDGRRIAFSMIGEGISVIDVDRKNIHKLAGGPGWDGTPAWSPDGRKIAFFSSRRKEHADPEIYVMDADEANPQRLTNRPTFADWCPVWSPDGQQIAFVSGLPGQGFSLYVMDADGKNPRELATFAWWDSRPTWSPNGQRIAFASKRDGAEEIYVVDSSGNNLRNLTNHPSRDRDPDWFDPAALFVSSDSKQITTWGRLKQLSK